MSFGLSAATIALIGTGATVGMGLYSANQAGKAADAQIQSGKDANVLAKQVSDDQIALQREQFNKQIELNQPAIDAGNTGRNRLMQLLGLTPGGDANGSAMKDFSMADFQSDPGYAFRLSEGQKGVERSAAARGGLLSGAAAKDMNRFTQGLASQDYQAAFDRFQTNRANKLNPLQSMTGTGQTASGALGAAGRDFANGAGQAMGNYGAQAGQNLTGMGNARASGYVGSANALTGGLTQAYNGYQQNQLMQRLFDKPPALGGSASTSPAGTYFDGYGNMPMGG